MSRETLLALHIIFVVTWFAGLFYIVRLFIYHTEAETKPEPEKTILQNQYKIMERRLWYGITWPSMVLTLTFGFILAWPYFENWDWDAFNWLVVKLTLVAGLILYHLQCGRIYNQLTKNIFKFSSFKLRMFNEIATLFLVAIVFVVEYKRFDFKTAAIGIGIFAALMLLSIIIYKRKRGK